MGALLGLGAGIGLLLIWSVWAVPHRPRPSDARPNAVERMLERAGLTTVSGNGFLTMCVLVAVAAGVLVQALTRTPPVAAVAAAGAGWLPVTIVRVRGRRRQREFLEVWPEAVDDLASAVRSGMGLPEALGALSHRGPEALRPAFAQFALDYQVTGRFGDSLDRLKHRLADPVGDRVVEGLRVAREVGGGELGRLLRNLSSYLREDARTRSELESRQSWVINGARLGVAAPWLVLGFMALQPDMIQRFASAGGALVLAIGAGLCVIAYRIMIRIGRLPTERRILAVERPVELVGAEGREA